MERLGLPAHLRTALRQYYDANLAWKKVNNRKEKEKSRGLPLRITEDGRSTDNGIGLPNAPTDIVVPQTFPPPPPLDQEDVDEEDARQEDARQEDDPDAAAVSSPLETWTICQLYAELARVAERKVKGKVKRKKLEGGGYFYGCNVPFFADELDGEDRKLFNNKAPDEWRDSAMFKDVSLEDGADDDADDQGGEDDDDSDSEYDQEDEEDDQEEEEDEEDGAEGENGGGGGGAEEEEEEEEDDYTPEEALAELREVADVKDPKATYAQCTDQGFRFSKDLPIFLTKRLTSPTTSRSEKQQTRLLYARAALKLALTTPPIEAYSCDDPSCAHLPPFKDVTKLDRHTHLHHVNPAIKARYKQRITGCPYCILWVIQNSANLHRHLPAELLDGPEIIRSIKVSELEEILEWEKLTEQWPRPLWKKAIFKSGTYRQLGVKRSAADGDGSEEEEEEDEGEEEDDDSVQSEEETDPANDDEDWIERDVEYETAKVDDDEEVEEEEEEEEEGRYSGARCAS